MAHWDDDDEPDEEDLDDGAESESLGSAVMVADMADAWFQAATRYRLLTAEDEVRCGQGQRVCSCCRDAGEALVNHNLRLVVSMARRYRLGAMHAASREDIWQAGAMGLMTAAAKWDWQLGNRFSTYATWWIRQAISRWLADYGYTIREPAYRHARRNQALRSGQDFDELLIPASLDVHATKHADDTDFLVNVLPDPQGVDPLETAVAADTREHLFAAMRETLTPREALILALRFGLGDATGQGMTLEDVGKQIGITRERVRQVQDVAIRKLRGVLEYDPFSGLRTRSGRLYYRQPPKPSQTKPTQPKKTTQRPAPSVSSPATGRETREPQRQSVTTKATATKSRRRAPSRMSAPACGVEVVEVSSLRVTDARPAASVAGLGISAGKRNTPGGKVTRGERRSNKRTA